ncbi:hypothetical protein CONPUDRAFT_155485 [Coniophora puteana RWD-64-598 SS2]|uniref:Uncharacterized protein n=1 Tax=Coniophora puteana (strain RWD-64-598) TaxID=741705 RepID=A0A5M3MM53_CONPW|nr:uncharacterized protein CONPUDRAFT_155485 [Coniophora puteana RWD-64-598 SS2]EIW80126.1 hypothetical protein CONPUDRAFT_155485 [Coniophora puteana RWD-64-598 SS2]
MYLGRYQYQAPPSSGSGRTTPGSNTTSRPPSRTNSIHRSNSQTTPAHTSHPRPVSQGSASRSLPMTFSQSARRNPSDAATPMPLSQPRRVSSNENLPPSITAGIRRTRDDFESESDVNTLQLSGQDIKRFKSVADTIAASLEIDKNVLHEFVELGNIVPMLIDIRAHQEAATMSNEDKTRHMWDNKLQSKDYRSMVTVRLTAALVSSSLTAFVVRFTDEVMAFISRNPAVFGVDDSVLNDHHLQRSLYRFISSASGSVRGSIKNLVIDSILKDWSIIELCSRLAASAQRMPTDSSHWRKWATVRFFTRQFLIGIGHFDKPRTVSLDQLYSAQIAPFLHPDLYSVISHKLGIDVRADVADAGGDGQLSGLGQGLDEDGHLPPEDLAPPVSGPTDADEPIGPVNGDDRDFLPETQPQDSYDYPYQVNGGEEPEDLPDDDTGNDTVGNDSIGAVNGDDSFFTNISASDVHVSTPIETPRVPPSGFFPVTAADGQVTPTQWTMREYWDYMDSSFGNLRRLALSRVRKNPMPGLTLDRARDAEDNHCVSPVSGLTLVVLTIIVARFPASSRRLRVASFFAIRTTISFWSSLRLE